MTAFKAAWRDIRSIEGHRLELAAAAEAAQAWAWAARASEA